MKKLTRSEFCHYMERLCETYKAQEVFVDKLNKVFPGAFEQIYDIDTTNLTVDILADLMEDKDEWIDFYVYEKHCDGFEWQDENDVCHWCGSPDDLWELMMDDE